MKRIWNFLGDVRVTFWLLIAIMATMYAGSLLASIDYKLFDGMNGRAVQDWFLETGITRLAYTAWVPFLFALFGAFGINTVACTSSRFVAVLARRRSLSVRRLLVLLSPSLIHVIFLVILAGHFATFVVIEQVRAPLSEKGRFELPDKSGLTVEKIEYENFPDSSRLAGRVSQVRVALLPDGGDGERVVTEFTRPASYRGYDLHLDMMGKRENRDAPRPAQATPMPKKSNIDDETCNKEKLYHIGHFKPTNRPELYLVATRDPGLPLLAIGFAIMLSVMGFYFANYRSAE